VRPDHAAHRARVPVYGLVAGCDDGLVAQWFPDGVLPGMGLVNGMLADRVG